MDANSSRKESPRKTADRPAKPFADYPLYSHPNGYWSKKVAGKIYNFGRWGRMKAGKVERLPDDEFERGWRDALDELKRTFGDVSAGRFNGVRVIKSSPQDAAPARLTVKELVNRFLTAKKRKMEAGELTRRSFQELEATGHRLAAALGKERSVEDLKPANFEKLRADIAKTCGPVRLGNEIVRVKSYFKYAADNHLIPSPIVYGSEFKKPDKSVLRRHKASQDKKLFTPAEIRSLVDAADVRMKAMVYLGINAGAGNTDVSNLAFGHLDLEAGWLNYPRGKTGIGRRVPLWHETVAALKAAIAARPVPKDKKADGNIVLLPDGERYVLVSEKSRTDLVSQHFGKLLRTLKINGRQGLGFYSLRHTFATVGLQTGDRDAVKSLMGHAFGDVLATYDEEGPSDARLRAVVEHVRRWLFAVK